jgi:hypothetical protein
MQACTLILQTKQEFYKKTSKRSKQNEENKNFATTLFKIKKITKIPFGILVAILKSPS